MTTKILTGAYPGGYTLSAAYSGLDVQSGASVGGTGVSAAFFAAIQNDGVIHAAGNSDGVLLGAGGQIANGSPTDTTALIEGYRGLLCLQSASLTLANYGSIVGAGKGWGVYISQSAANVTNGSTSDRGALIEGYRGLFQGQATASISNLGTIMGDLSSTGGKGVLLNRSGGVLDNGSTSDVTAAIEGFQGVDSVQGTESITNFGVITGNGSSSGGVGVYLSAGSLANGSAADTVATIGGLIGVYARGSIANYGTIAGGGSTASGIGVLLTGGVLTNGSATDAAALIEGYSGIIGERYSNVPTISNFGTIVGATTVSRGAGVRLTYGAGTLTNGSAADTAALIKGFVGVYGGSVVSNFATIMGAQTASRGAGVGGEAIVTNGSASDTGALIEGFTGVYGGSTITNYGTIYGTGGVAVDLVSARGVLQVEAGCVFRGAALGDSGTLDLASGAGTISGLSGDNVTISGSMTPTTFTNFGTLQVSGGASFALTGTSTFGAGGTTTLIDNATLLLASTIKGTGTLTVAGGTLTLGKGASVGLASAAFGAGSTLNGVGTLTLTNATLAGLTVAGTVVLDDIGTFDQTGTITLTRNARGPRLIVAAGATYRLNRGVNIARGTSSAPVIVVDGLFLTQGGSGTSVGVAIADNGTIESTGGLLSFSGGVTGTGLLKIDGFSTLLFANSVASTLTATFNGAESRLALSEPSVFAATIAGFTVDESIDLIGIAATGATLNGSNQLVIANGTATIATLQLTGTYTGATFATSSDGHGGTSITVSGGSGAVSAAHGFVAAMAATSPAIGAGHVLEARPAENLRLILGSPRAALS